MDSDDEDTDSGSNMDSESMEIRIETGISSKFHLFITIQFILHLEGDRLQQTYSIRRGNQHRERSLIIQWAGELDDKCFTDSAEFVGKISSTY